MAVNKFGRLVAPGDARDLQYRPRVAMLQIAEQVGKPTPRTRPYRDGPLLNQGNTPQCVGYSCRGLIDGAPVMTKPTIGPSPSQIYSVAQQNDEWPGVNYEGTSVRAGMKALQMAQTISSFLWAQSVPEAIAWMNGGYGTIVVGTNWYAEMSDVGNDGFMREPASNLSTPIGGHAWRWIWYDAKKRGILMRNSWGTEFGWPTRQADVLSGYAFVSIALAERLLREDGEIAAPTQIPIRASKPE